MLYNTLLQGEWCSTKTLLYGDCCNNTIDNDIITRGILCYTTHYCKENDAQQRHCYTGIAVTIQQWHYYKGNSVLYNTLLQGEWCLTKTATRGLLYNTIAIITWGVMYNTGDIFIHRPECSDHQAQSIFNQYFIVSKTRVTDAETWSELESLPAVSVVPRIRFYS